LSTSGQKKPIKRLIASEEVIIVERTGEKRKSSLQVGFPYMDRKMGTFACPLNIERRYNIFGETSLQAVCLGIKFMGQRLNDMVDVGYQVLNKEGQRFPITSYFNVKDKFLKARHSRLLAKSRLGSLLAQHDLAAGYVVGDWPGGKNLKKAVQWYRKAAAKGDSESQYDLGWMTLLGEGTDKNINKAIGLFEKAAYGGNESAAALLADLFADGLRGVPRDHKLAKYWKEFRLSKGRNGNEFSQALTAFQKKDYKKSFPILLRFAESGNAEAQCLIGNFYELGLGRPANRDEARKWYLQSSEKGYGLASNNLGTLFSQDGNAAKAKHWYDKARQQGFSHSPIINRSDRK
jgi:TPR repeat protein